MDGWDEFPAAADLPPPLPAAGSWDEFKPVEQAQAPAVQASGWDEFKPVEQAKPKLPEAEGMLSTFAREFAHGAPGAVTGTAAGLAGAGAGSVLGLPGTIVGGLVGGVAGGMAGEKIKELGLEAAGYDDAAQRKANEEANKWTSAAGRAAAVVLGFGRGAVTNVAKEAPGLIARYGPEVAARGGSAAIGGGFETGRQLVQEGKISSIPDIALQTAAGAVYNKPRGWAEPFEQFGTQLGAKIRPPPPVAPEPIAPAARPPAQGEMPWGAERQPGLPLGPEPRPDIPTGQPGAREGQPWQPELPLEPLPRLNPQTGQYEAPFAEPGHQRDLPLEGGAGLKPQPHGSATAEAAGGASESPAPPSRTADIGDPQNKIERTRIDYSKDSEEKAQIRATEGAGAAPINGVDPDLQHVFTFGRGSNAHKAEQAPPVGPPEEFGQYGARLAQEFPRIPGAETMARPLEQNQRTGVPSGIQQGLLEAPAGSTRLYRGENSPRGLFTTNPAEAANYGPVHYVDVEGRNMPQFRPGGDPARPGELVTRNPVYEQRAQPMAQRPLTEPVPQTTGIEQASPDLNAQVKQALAPPPGAELPIQKTGPAITVDKTGTKPGSLPGGNLPSVAEVPRLKTPPEGIPPISGIPPVAEAPLKLRIVKEGNRHLLMRGDEVLQGYPNRGAAQRGKAVIERQQAAAGVPTTEAIRREGKRGLSGRLIETRPMNVSPKVGNRILEAGAEKVETTPRPKVSAEPTMQAMARQPTPDEAAILARVATPKTTAKIPTSLTEVKSSLDKIYTNVVNDIHPLHKLVKELSQGQTIPGEKDPYRLARLTRGSYEQTQHMLSKGTFDYDTKVNTGKGLKDVLSPVKNDMDGFTAYAVAKRTVELEGRNITTGVPLAEANRVVATGAGKYEPVFRELVDFQTRTLNYLQKSGILSAQDVAKMQAKNKEFVPFWRNMEPDPATGGPGGGLKVRDPLKEIEGSTREVINPIDTIIRNTHAYVSLAERNRVWQSLKELAGAHPQGHQFMQRVGQAGPDTIQMFNNGKPEFYKVDPQVAGAANALNADTMGMITNILSKPASWLRAGATLSPEFIARNPIRDQFSAFINSKYGYIPVYDVFRNLGSMFRKDEMYQNWVKHGGANATLVSLDRQAIGLDPKTAISRATGVVKSPIEALRIASEFMENITRLGEFRRGIEKGVHPSEAAFTSREITLDFARMGAKMKALNAIIPFMNAQIQGVDRTARAFKDNPVSTLAKVGISVTAPSVMLWFANQGDPRMKEIPQWEKDAFWIVPTDKWTALSDKDAAKVHKDLKRQRPDGTWEHNTGTIHKIPKPFEIGVLFGSIPERALDAFVAKNPKAFQDLHKSVVHALTPGLIPQAFNPLIEQFANRSMFTGRPLVPKYLEGVTPKQQATPYTSETAQKLGDMVSQIAPKSSFSSPIILENYIKQWSGGLGTHALQLLDKGLEKSGAPAKPESTAADMPLLKAFAVRYPGSGAQSIQDFYKTYNERKQANTTNKMLIKSGRKDEIEQKTSPQLDGLHKALGEQHKYVRAVHNNPTMSSQDKRHLIDMAYEQMIKVARQGNEAFARSAGGP